MKVILFADDSTTYVTNYSLPELFRCVNEDLNVLSRWFRINTTILPEKLLSLNTAKPSIFLLQKECTYTSTDTDIL